jgi:hypothetical protein
MARFKLETAVRSAFVVTYLETLFSLDLDRVWKMSKFDKKRLVSAVIGSLKLCKFRRLKLDRI